VAIVTHIESLAPEMAIPARWRLLRHLRRSKVTLLTSVVSAEVMRNGVWLIFPDGHSDTIPADSVVIAGEVAPDPETRRLFAAVLPRVYQIGDAARIGLIPEAFSSAARLVDEVSREQAERQDTVAGVSPRVDGSEDAG
jgi:hypothetical protein